MFENGPMQRIVQRVCAGFCLGEFRCNFEIVPRSVQAELIQAVAAKNQLRELIVKSKKTFYDYLKAYVTSEGVSLIKIYKQIVLRERTICKLLNMFKPSGTLLVALCWIPEERTKDLLALELKTESGNVIYT